MTASGTGSPGRTARATDRGGGPVAEAERWREADRRLLANALGEWCYEGLLTAEAEPGGRYRVVLGDVAYTFAATPGAFGWLRVDPYTALRYGSGLLGDRSGAPATDVRRLLVDAAPMIGADAATVAGYLGELTATLAADATADPGTAAELRALDHAELEGFLAGHPWIVANKGRVGFSADDLARYAPGSRRRLRLPWLAVHRGLAEFRGTPDLSEHLVRRHELGDDAVTAFADRLRSAGLDPEAYVWLPVHPWQLDRTIRTGYAGELATGRIVELGETPDEYRPQQSIRTVTNVSDRLRYDVKLPLSILNTSVWRGIPPHCTAGAPVLTRWLHGLFARDRFLAEECRAVFLGEVASVTVRHPYLTGIGGVPYRHLETLGCVWREPVSAYAEADETVRPLSALLHVDRDGRPFVAELVAASGKPAADWLRALFDTVLGPVLHVLFRYGITFNPHGQNALVSYAPDETPRRLFLKDFVDDVELSAVEEPARAPEPDGLVPRKPPEAVRQHVVDSVLIGHFRYLAALCADHLGVTGHRFWSLVRAAVTVAQQRFEAVSAEYDLLVAEFPRYRLNTDRLVVTGYGDHAVRHAIRASGTVPNPLASRGGDAGPAVPAVPDDTGDRDRGGDRGGGHRGSRPQCGQ